MLKQIGLLLFICVALCSCEPKGSKKEFEAVKKLFNQNKNEEGIVLTEQTTKLYPEDTASVEAAKLAAETCLKDSKTCGDREEIFLKFIIKRSSSEQDQIKSLKRLCEIYYDKGLYSQVVVEMSRLLSKQEFQDGRLEIRLKLARTNFYIKNFYQAQTELKKYLTEAKTEEEKFSGYQLQADIQAADKKYADAMKTYKYIFDNFKELYLKNQIYMNEVLLMEDQKQLDQAIGFLENLKPQIENHDFIQAKIERLKERKALLPGASGLKR